MRDLLIVVLIAACMSTVQSRRRHGMPHGTTVGGKGVPAMSCVVADFPLQQNFDVQRYVGTWYTIAHSADSTYPYHRRSHYSLQENGNLAMATHRIFEQNGCSSAMQFQADAYLPEGETVGSKLSLQPRGFNVPPDDYWIVYTDYVDHAMVYSCSDKTATGTCREGTAHVWIMSRRPTISRGARRHLMSLLPSLCVDRSTLIDVPSECDEELGVSAAAQPVVTPTPCLVNNFQTMADFDKSQYTGTWYVISHLQDDVYPYHRISHYTLNEDGSFGMVTHRISGADSCSTAWRFEGQAYLSPESTSSSKLLLKPFGMPVQGEDYWVIYTDYTDHSLVYSCREQTEEGTCREGAVHVWLMSRNPTLSAAARSSMEGLLSGLCVDSASLVDTPNECDEVLGATSQTNPESANQCVVHNFQTMPDFDKSQYVGTWYIISHLQERIYPYHRISRYSVAEDGSITMATDRITEPDQCSSAWHFQATATQPEESTTESKLLLKPVGISVEGDDYWVIYTDYTDHALVYSCQRKNLDGTCEEGAVHTWLMSRGPKLNDVARSHMLSILTTLCVDPTQLVDTPTECDETLGSSDTDSRSCVVSDFAVMEDFDVNQYVGTWYVVSHRQDQIYPYHRISHYTLAEDGSLSMATDRIIGANQCSSAWHFQAKAFLPEGSETPAKLLLKPIGMPRKADDYWVIYTDYTDHALVYSCSAKNEDGTCQEGAHHAWLMSRHPVLSSAARTRMESLLADMCIDAAELVETPTECDETLAVAEHQHDSVPRTRSCIVNDFHVMENFDKNQYAGVWYTVAQVQPTEYPFHRVSNYTLQENGFLAMGTDRIFSSGDCNAMHFDAEAFQVDAVSNSGKLLLQPLGRSMPAGDYWVIDTDYTDHALVYSCDRQHEDGTCLEGRAHVWFMSRQPVLSQTALTHMISLMPDLCVEPTLLRNTLKKCDTELGIPRLPSELGESSCAIADFMVKENFVIEKFLGDWYELGHTDNEYYMLLPDMEMITFGGPPTESTANMGIVMKNLRLNGICYNKNMPGFGWLNTDNPAKFVVSFPLIPNQYDIPDVVNHWVLDTDYDNYAITFTCRRVMGDGSCDPRAEGLWILGRTRQLSADIWETINRHIRDVCIDPTTVVQNPEPCPTVTPQASVRAAVRSCDNSEFGCCLLSDIAAVDADYSNCPRVASPVAGQLIPEAPVALTEGDVECDPRINCKMFCPDGFQIDSNGCEICQCAPQVTEAPPTTTTEATGLCQQRYNIVMAKLKNSSPREGFYVPRCDANGNYQILQCLYPEQACWCADNATGVRLRKASYDGDVPSCDP